MPGYRLYSRVFLAVLAGRLPIFVLGWPATGAGALPDGFKQEAVADRRRLGPDRFCNRDGG